LSDHAGACTLACMDERSLERRLAPYAARGRRVDRSSFRRAGSHGLRARIDQRVQDAVLQFELDRLLYDIEVDAMHRWLRALVAFDAYCARRGR
jgi:hypothetical protein